MVICIDMAAVRWFMGREENTGAAGEVKRRSWELGVGWDECTGAGKTAALGG
jgi:hypothetical protein